MKESWALVSLEGDDAQSFVEGQITQSMRNDSWFALLNPESDVVSAGKLLVAGDIVSLVVPAEDAQRVVDRLNRFKLRSKFEMRMSETESPFSSVEERILAGWPSSKEFSSRLTPHAFGSQFVQSVVDFTKGCYTGQELVGRLDARGGNTPWKMVRLQGDPTAIEIFIRQGPDGPKELTSVFKYESDVLALAIVHRSAQEVDGVSTTWL
jgi:folate-binding protein YgfZ